MIRTHREDRLVNPGLCRPYRTQDLDVGTHPGRRFTLPLYVVVALQAAKTYVAQHAH